jgi:hypothetical protein
MKNNSIYLPGFPIRFGRPRINHKKRAAEIFESLRERRLWELERFFSPWVSSSLLKLENTGENSRDRVFSPYTTFYAFFFQLLSGSSCSEAVKQVQSWLHRQRRQVPSSNTSAYCQARKRISMKLLCSIDKGVVKSLEEKIPVENLWHERHVKVVDGTGLSMSDTTMNQKCWPQNGAMKPGCGFPQMNLVGFFSLATGALLGWAEGNKHNHETMLWRQLWKLIKRKDIILGDRAYCSYYNVFSLSKLGADSVFRLHQCRLVSWKDGIRLGKNDRLVTWNRTKVRSKGVSKEEWKRLPRKIQVRVVDVPVLIPGFRSQKFTLVTTLTDAKTYTPEMLAELYLHRWQVELFFKDIKTTLGMDILRSKSPDQVRKELALYVILYNVIRAVMLSASKQKSVPLQRISFKGTIKQLSQWHWLFLLQAKSIGDFHLLLDEFYNAIVSSPILNRPGRNEPRTKKRRPKNFQMMNKPRKKMVIDCHRNLTERKNAFHALS